MRLRPILILIAAVLPVTALAVPVRYEFSGTLYQSMTTIPEWYDFEFSGATFSGSFTLETDAPQLAGDAHSAFYYDAINDLQLSIGPAGSLASYQQSELPMFEGFPYTSSLYFLNDFDPSGDGSFIYDMASFGVNLQALPGDPVNLRRGFGLSAFSYPSTLFPALPTLDELPSGTGQPWSASLWLAVDEGNENYRQASYGATVNLVRATSVPEPGTLALLAAGLAGALFVRRRTAEDFKGR